MYAAKPYKYQSDEPADVRVFTLSDFKYKTSLEVCMLHKGNHLTQKADTTMASSVSCMSSTLCIDMLKYILPPSSIIHLPDQFSRHIINCSKCAKTITQISGLYE